MMDIDYRLILWCVYIGVLIAAVISCYQKSVSGRLLRALMAQSCNSPDAARTLTELGLDTVKGLRSALKPTRALCRLITAVSPEAESAENKRTFDFSVTKFYLSPAHEEKASAFLRTGISWLMLIPVAIGGLIVVLLGYMFIPSLYTLFAELLS